MGQVWSKANFDGTNKAGHRGGRGSVLAVVSQNPGGDGVWGTGDDVDAPLNAESMSISIDNAPGGNCFDRMDRVRNFGSLHRVGAQFVFADGSVHFITESINRNVYRALGSIGGGEVATAP